MSTPVAFVTSKPEHGNSDEPVFLSGITNPQMVYQLSIALLGENVKAAQTNEMTSRASDLLGAQAGPEMLGKTQVFLASNSERAIPGTGFADLLDVVSMYVVEDVDSLMLVAERPDLRSFLVASRDQIREAFGENVIVQLTRWFDSESHDTTKLLVNIRTDLSAREAARRLISFIDDWVVDRSIGIENDIMFDVSQL